LPIAVDVGARVEVRACVDVEPDHGIDQTDPGDLNEVVARLAASVETARDVVGQRQASLDDAVTLAAELCRVL